MKVFRIFLQETYSILDASFYDKAITGAKNTNWTNNNNNITVTVGEEYTTLTAGIDNNQNRYIVPSENIPSVPFVVEFNKHNTVNDGILLIISSRTINLYSLWNNKLRDANHIKLTVIDGNISCEHDGTVETATVSYTNLDGIQFRINNFAAGSLQYSDFMIYPI